MLTLTTLLAAAILAAPPTPHVVLDANLRRIPAELTQIAPDRIRYNDAQGVPRSAARAEVLAVLPARPDDLGEPIAVSARGRGLAVRIVLELTDGQRYIGKPAPPGAKETLAWETKLLGVVTVPFDRVARVVLHPELVDEAADRPSGKEDTIALLNGDRVTGLVESFGQTVAIESGGQHLSIGIDRVSWMALANPPATPPRILVRLDDGAVIGAATVQASDAGEVTLALPANAGTESTSIKLPISEVAAIWFDAARLTPLAVIPVDHFEASAGRRWTRPPTVFGGGGAGQAGDIEIPGPMTVEWAMPAATTAAIKFAGSVVLPRRSLEWGDCQVTFDIRPATGDWAQLWTQRVNSDSPSADFNLTLPRGATRLRIRIEPGGDGSIQDRIIIRDAVLLTQ